MTDGSSDTLFTTVVESNDTTVAQRQLQFALALLTGNLSGNRTVYLVGQPVLAGYGFQLQYGAYIFI